MFTQTTWDKEGFPIRDPDSTTYTGAIETAEEFGKRIYLEAWNRGWSRAEKKVVMGDGAEWIWNLADQHFPGAVQIVDLYHARQHLWELARRLYPNDEGEQKAWMKVHQKRLLDKGKIEKLVAALRSIDLHQPRSRREDSHRSRLLREKCRAHALSQVPPPASVRRLGRHRSRLQDRHRFPPQTVRHVLDRSRSQRHHCPTLLPPQRPVRGLLGGAPGGLTSTSMSRTRWVQWSGSRGRTMNRFHHWLCRSAQWRKTMHQRVPWVVSTADLGPRVLELGPGPGFGTDVLRRSVEHLTAIEVDAGLAASLRSRLRGSNVQVIAGDATAMPFPDAQFSGVVSFTMLHHVPSA